MSAARDRILARVRAALGRDAPLAQPQRQPLRDYLAEHPAGPRPQPPADLVARFRAQALRSSTSVEAVETAAAVPGAIARYLQSEGLPRAAVVWPELAQCDWEGAGIAAEARAARADDGVGITGCFCALAETGTLLQLSAPQRPAATSLLPPVHVAVLPAARIVATMEDAWMLLRCEQGRMPRAANFISGPSRTADIEQTLVLGAHGPCRVHIVVIAG